MDLWLEQRGREFIAGSLMALSKEWDTWNKQWEGIGSLIVLVKYDNMVPVPVKYNTGE